MRFALFVELAVVVVAVVEIVGTILPFSLSPNQFVPTLHHHHTCVAFKYSFVLCF